MLEISDGVAPGLKPGALRNYNRYPYVHIKGSDRLVLNLAGSHARTIHHCPQCHQGLVVTGYCKYTLGNSALQEPVTQ